MGPSESIRGPNITCHTHKPAGELSQARERLTILVIALGTMLVPLNSTMIAVALPEIIGDYGVTLTRAGWLITGYLIAMASLQPLAGKIGDRYGRRRLLLGGISLFGLASFAAALAPNLPVLLFLRILQGAAGALIVPNGSALLRDVLPEHRRGAGFGLLGAGIAIAAASGPSLGGVLVETVGWRSIFYINLLLVVPAALMGWQWLPRRLNPRMDRPFDRLGAAMLPILLIASAWLLLSFSQGGMSPILAIGIPVILVSAFAFGRYESKQTDPIVQLNFFRSRSFSSAASGIGFGNMAMYSLLVSIPILLAARSDSSLRIGLILTVMSAGMTVTSILGGRLIDQFGRRAPTMAGLVLLAVGTLPIALNGSEVTIPELLVGLSLVGLGLGLAMPGLQITAVESVAKADAGSASGLYSTSRYLGSIIGSAIIAGILGSSQTGIDGIGMVFILAFVAAVLSAISSAGLRARPGVDDVRSL